MWRHPFHSPFPPLRLLQELKSRYQALEPAACRPLWERAYEVAGRDPAPGSGGQVARRKPLHVLGGGRPRQLVNPEVLKV